MGEEGVVVDEVAGVDVGACPEDEAQHGGGRQCDLRLDIGAREAGPEQGQPRTGGTEQHPHGVMGKVVGDVGIAEGVDVEEAHRGEERHQIACPEGHRPANATGDGEVGQPNPYAEGGQQPQPRQRPPVGDVPAGVEEHEVEREDQLGEVEPGHDARELQTADERQGELLPGVESPGELHADPVGEGLGDVFLAGSDDVAVLDVGGEEAEPEGDDEHRGDVGEVSGVELALPPEHQQQDDGDGGGHGLGEHGAEEGEAGEDEQVVVGRRSLGGFGFVVGSDAGKLQIDGEGGECEEEGERVFALAGPCDGLGHEGVECEQGGAEERAGHTESAEQFPQHDGAGGVDEAVDDAVGQGRASKDLILQPEGGVGEGVVLRRPAGFEADLGPDGDESVEVAQGGHARVAVVVPDEFRGEAGDVGEQHEDCEKTAPEPPFLWGGLGGEGDAEGVGGGGR